MLVKLDWDLHVTWTHRSHLFTRRCLSLFKINVLTTSWINSYLPPANEVMFLLMSVILSTGEWVSVWGVSLRETSSWTEAPPWTETPSLVRDPPGQRTPQTETPHGQRPPWQRPLDRDPLYGKERAVCILLECIPDFMIPPEQYFLFRRISHFSWDFNRLQHFFQIFSTDILTWLH